MDSSQGLDFDCIVVREAKSGQFLGHVIERIQICEDKDEMAWSAGWERDNMVRTWVLSWVAHGSGVFGGSGSGSAVTVAAGSGGLVGWVVDLAVSLGSGLWLVVLELGEFCKTSSTWRLQTCPSPSCTR